MRIPLIWLKDYVKLPDDLKLLTDRLTMAGHLLDKIDQTKKDTVIDLELRGNRADCYSIFGIAREVSAIFSKPVNYPDLYSKTLKNVQQLPECVNTIKTPLVKRVMMVVIKNVKILPSPTWTKSKLEAYGVPSINNIVDLTNFVMLELGEPMHAFDLDKIGKNIQIRLAKNGEKMMTFQGTTLTLTNDDLVWANTKSLLSVAGAIGEKNHSITDTTKNILVEAANYDRANIRRTIRRHNLNTDAGLRHEKELDKNLVKDAIYRFLQLVEENNWGTIEQKVFDYYPSPAKNIVINFDYKRIEEIGGVKIENKAVKDILKRLNFKINKETSSGLSVICPTYRTDVVQEEDLVEEVLRIYGYDKINPKILDLEIPPIITPPEVTQENDLKTTLVSLGFDEIISSAFVKESYVSTNKLLDDIKNVQPVIITNPPSPDVEKMRMSLNPNLLEFTRRSIAERGEETRLFEIGKIYYRQSNKYFEKRKLGISYWKKTASNFKDFKGYLEAFMDIMNLKKQQIEDLFIFKVSDENIFYAELDLDTIINKTERAAVQLWPKYPPIIEDLTLIIPVNIQISAIIKLIKSVNSLIRNVRLIDSFEQTKTFRIIYADPKKTLTDVEVLEIRKKILSILKKNLQIELRGRG